MVCVGVGGVPSSRTCRALGAKCLVAWEQVCRAKAASGFGIKCLATQNLCLQMKPLHRVHSSATSPWAPWAWSLISGLVAAGKRPVVVPHWRALVDLMPRFLEISTVTLGNGEHTSFWTNDWLGGGALYVYSRMSVLFSRVVNVQASVAVCAPLRPVSY
jgi:hypothetical protein